MARSVAGLSQRTVGSLVGRSHSYIGRLERGELLVVDMRIVAVVAAVLGLDLRVMTYPTGVPVRDAPHLALIGRLRARVSPTLVWRTEVPIPLPGDLRTADVVIGPPGTQAMVEAETRLSDLQALERRWTAKRRDLGCARFILLLSDTRHNRAILDAYPAFRAGFQLSARSCLAALGLGRVPTGDAIILL